MQCRVHQITGEHLVRLKDYSLLTVIIISISDFIPATATTFKVSMSPWTNYTFRVIARNKVEL